MLRKQRKKTSDVAYARKLKQLAKVKKLKACRRSHTIRKLDEDVIYEAAKNAGIWTPSFPWARGRITVRFMKTWYPMYWQFGGPKVYKFEHGYVEDIKRIFENWPTWQAKDQWLMRGSALPDLLGEETLQWFSTKFSTWTGIYLPYFELEHDGHTKTISQHRKIIQVRPLVILNPLTSKNLEKL